MRDPVVWIALLLALALRAGLLLLYPYAPGTGDESLHYVMAVLVTELGHGVIGHWGPGYEVFLASIFSVSGPDPFAAKLVQVLVSTASVAMVWTIAARAGGVRAGRIAAFLAALYPSLVAYATYLFSETLFLFLILGGITLLFGLRGERTRLRCIGAGIFFGLATLTRSLVLYFLPVWIVWALLRGRRREAAEAGIILLTVLAMLLPWTARNQARYDGFLLVDGTVAQTSYIAFSEVLFSTDLGFDDWRQQLPRSRPRCPFESVPGLEPLPPVSETAALFPPPARSVLTSRAMLASRLLEVSRLSTLDFPRMQRCETSRALRFAIENPGVVVKQMLRRFYAFWGPNSFLLRSVAYGIYPDGPLQRGAYPWLKWWVVASYLLVMVPALLELSRAGARGAPPVLEWSALFCIFYLGIHLVAVSYSRYRLPIMPIAVVLGSLWLASPHLPRGRVRAGITWVLVAGFLWLSADYVMTGLPW